MAPVTSSPAGGLAARPRWYAHAYNDAALYRVAAGLAWLPRRARLGLARQVGRLALRLMPAERAAIAKTLARVTGAKLIRQGSALTIAETGFKHAG